MIGDIDLFLDSIKEKELYYFVSDRIDSIEPHYYVCIKRTDNDIFILGCCTSQFEKRERFIIQRGLPTTTLVRIKTDKINNAPLTADTFVDCNQVHPYTIDEFRDLCNDGKVSHAGKISEDSYYQILIGINDSPKIDNEYKDVIPHPDSYEEQA